MPDLDLSTQSFQSTVMFALGKPRLPSKVKLTEQDRRVLAEAVAEHFQRCGWTVAASQRQIGPDIMYNQSKGR